MGKRGFSNSYWTDTFVRPPFPESRGARLQGKIGAGSSARS